MKTYKFGPNVRYCVLRSALNRVLIPAQACRGKMVQNRTGIMDLQNKNYIARARETPHHKRLEQERFINMKLTE